MWSSGQLFGPHHAQEVIVTIGNTVLYQCKNQIKFDILFLTGISRFHIKVESIRYK